MFSTITNCGIEVVYNKEFFLKYKKDDKIIFDGIMLIGNNLDYESILVFAGYKNQKNDKIDHNIEIIGKIAWSEIHAATSKETVKRLKEEVMKMFSSIPDFSGLDCPKMKMDDVLAQRIMMISEE